LLIETRSPSANFVLHVVLIRHLFSLKHGTIDKGQGGKFGGNVKFNCPLLARLLIRDYNNAGAAGMHVIWR
jgi:hypothetical protein